MNKGSILTFLILGAASAVASIVLLVLGEGPGVVPAVSVTCSCTAVVLMSIRR